MGNDRFLFSILITTKNRLIDLAFTLDKIKYLLDRKMFVAPINKRELFLLIFEYLFFINSNV